MNRTEMAKHANAEQQLLLSVVIKQLKAEGDFEAAEIGRQEWLQLKEEHTRLCGWTYEA
tara:strand:- start:216 stop:392 length:177 start_codon:yes stop_codon:yes gene_type:complete